MGMCLTQHLPGSVVPVREAGRHLTVEFSVFMEHKVPAGAVDTGGEGGSWEHNT